MPFLCIQVDADFININLYEDGQVALSRYIKIDPSDYDNNPDYVNIAVFDNLFRMIQFIGQRPGAKPLRQIMFYGVIRDFVALSNSIASFNIPAHVLSMPTNIVKFCEIDFSLYANAIGAFYKVDPLMEHVNLLQSKVVKSKQSANLFPLQILGVFAISAALVLGVRVVIAGINSSLVRDRERVQAEIDDGDFDARQGEMQLARGVLANFNEYRDRIEVSQLLFEYLPRGDLPQITQQFEEAERIVAADANMENSFYVYHGFAWSNYEISMTVYVAHDDAPANFVDALNQTGFFDQIVYSHFEWVERADLDEDVPEIPAIAGRNDVLGFRISMRLRGGHIFVGQGQGTPRDDGLFVYSGR
jgi:hypothetical protein